MAARKTRKKTTRTSTRKASASPILERLSPQVVWAVVVAMGLIAGTGVGLSFAETRAAEIASDGPSVVRIEWPEAIANGQPVAWPPAPVQQELLDQAYAIVAEHPGPFSATTLDALGTWLSETGWVSGVSSIRRLDSGVIDIHAVWRAPAAVVRDGAQDYLIASDGCRLRASWRADLSPFPTIIGARDARALAVVPGEVWPSESVQAGLELINLIESRLPGDQGSDQITGVDVSQFVRLHRLILRTDHGNSIIWGRPPSDPVPDAVSTETKLRQLAHLRHNPDFGYRIDAGQGLIDISSGPVLVEDRPSSAQNPPK
ncbi:MAG TPA: hypothetical protein ENJ00_07020 [Phycisphaerales bacterium]|nr:hypothetical protein [Phycisphaerales bacterium]